MITKTSFRTVITREDGNPYLIRYKLLRTPWFRIRLHHILLSDNDCLHDHPWRFISIILSGGYSERTFNTNALEPGLYTSKWYGPGSVLDRPAEWKHALELVRPAWTLVIMFKKERDWGFWTRKGFVRWQDYKSTNLCEQ